MPPTDSPYADDWREVARKDWQRARWMLENDDYEAVAYFLQQSLEKYLKAWLIERGWALKKTHELPLLLAEANAIRAGLVAHMDVCKRLAGYYFSQRYPSSGGPGASADDVARDREDTRLLIVDLFPDEPLDNPTS